MKLQIAADLLWTVLLHFYPSHALQLSENFKVFPNQVFSSSPVIRVEEVRGVIECARHCSQLEECLAANLGPGLAAGKKSCYLLLDDDVGNLVSSVDSQAIRKQTDTIDYCATLVGNPCQNGGTCISGSANFTCLCTDFCNGTTCECCTRHTFEGYTDTTIVGSPMAAFPDVDIDVFIDNTTDDRNWIVLMRRHDGSEDFVSKVWSDYKSGFGILTSEFWIGNDKMYYLTNNGSDWTVRFDLRSFGGECRYAEYSTFRVGDESSGYLLAIDGYSGNAGDGMAYPGSWNHNNQRFTTSDLDQDNAPGGGNCAVWVGGGWWYNYCAYVKLTGNYGPTVHPEQGIYWASWLGFDVYLERVEIKVRPTN